MSVAESRPSVAKLLSLLLLGLAIGIALPLLDRSKRHAAVEFSWVDKAVRTMAPASLRRIFAPEVELPHFMLRATMVATDSEGSTASFELEDGRYYALHPGSMLPGVGRLLEVTETGAVLDIEGHRQQVLIDATPLRTQGIQPLPTTAPSANASVDAEAAAPNAQRRVPGPKLVVPDNMPRNSDAPYDQPELNATPKPGQTIDTTVWD